MTNLDQRISEVTQSALELHYETFPKEAVYRLSVARAKNLQGWYVEMSAGSYKQTFNYFIGDRREVI